MTRGNIFLHLLIFSVPVFIGTVLQNLYSAVDTFLIGRYVSLDALASIGSVWGIMAVINALQQGITAGFSVRISHSFGKKDFTELRKHVSMSILLSLVFAIVLTSVSMILRRPLLVITHTPSDLVSDADTYLAVILSGTLASTFYNMFSNILRAIGDSKTPLIFLMLSSILNIIGDLLFIRYAGWEVMGVALATVISQTVSALLCYMYMRRKYEFLKISLHDLKFDRKICTSLLALGIPSAIHFSVNALGSMLVQVKMNSMGTLYVTSYTIALKIESMLASIFPALATSVMTFCGQNSGAALYGRVRKAVRISLITSLSISFVIFIATLLFTPQIASIFIQEDAPEIISNIELYLHINTFFYISVSIIFVFRSASQGLGSGKIPMVSSTIELISRIFVAIVLSELFGYAGLCCAGPLAWTCAAVYVVTAYSRQIKALDIVH